MDCTGISVFLDHLQSIKPMVEKHLRKIEDEVTALMGRTINLASPKQVHQVLFKELKLRCNLKASITSTSEKVLRVMLVKLAKT